MAYNDEIKNKEKYGNNPGYKGRQPYKEDIDAIVPTFITPKDVYSPLRVLEEKVISSRMIQRVEDDKIKPLRLMSEEVIGGIFNRVIFLKKRIEELNANILLRNKVHDSILVEIEKDIEDRMMFLQAISDINEKRNLKLDISVLRKERRNESVQFWRDLVELSTEMRKLEEEYEIETKIAEIFNNGNGE
ncbi:MAG TPA: hypothetical protein VJB05_03710 [archaeon]|nr:hypothetical protein [archaeon]